MVVYKSYLDKLELRVSSLQNEKEELEEELEEYKTRNLNQATSVSYYKEKYQFLSGMYSSLQEQKIQAENKAANYKKQLTEAHQELAEFRQRDTYMPQYIHIGDQPYQIMR